MSVEGLEFPRMVPLKLSLTYNPAQIGILYLRSPQDKRKQLYMIQLNEMIFQGDAEKITKALYQAHPRYLSADKIKPSQIQKFVEKLLEDLHKKLVEYDQEQIEADGQENAKRALKEVDDDLLDDSDDIGDMLDGI